MGTGPDGRTPTASSGAAADAALALAVALGDRFAAGAAARDRERRFPAEEVAALKASGLGALRVPAEHGGLGGDTRSLHRVTAAIAAGDPNVAQMLHIHLLGVEMIRDHVNIVPEARREYFRRIVEERQLLTNAYSELGTKTVDTFTVRLSRDAAAGGWRLAGRKFYCTGSLAGEFAYVVGVTDEPEPRTLLGFVDTDWPGVVIHEDWTGMGQRTTASGTMEFIDVLVPDDRLCEVGFLSPESLQGGLSQLLFASIMIGIARAALADAVDFVRTRSRPWVHSGVARAADDPYVLLRIGEMRALLDAAEATAEAAVDARRAAEAAPSIAARDRASVAISSAKYTATEAALRIGERLFQVCGASSSLEQHDYDRHWRNARTISLHDPADYKLRLIGDYLVNGASPPVSGYT